MLKLAGDQLTSRESYVKTSRFQIRLRDENGVFYTDTDEPQYTTKGQVPRVYSASTVVLDKRGHKQVVPRHLLDLAAVSWRL